MIPPSPHPERWTRQRWIAAVALILGVQLALLFLLSEKPAASAPLPLPPARIAMVLDPAANQHILELLAASDPTLFALANPRGFSGPGWLNPPGRQHRLQEWTEPDPELPPTPPNAALVLASYIRTNLAPVESPTIKYTPDLRSLARPVLAAPLLTTSLSPPEPNRPANTLPRPVPTWSNLDSRDPVAWLPPRFTNPAATWLSSAPANPPSSPTNHPAPARLRPAPALPVPTAVRPRA